MMEKLIVHRKTFKVIAVVTVVVTVALTALTAQALRDLDNAGDWTPLT
jgi:hypothetical protein